MRDKLKVIKAKAKPLLAKIIDVFPEYTIHDIRHSEKVIEILDWLVPDELKSGMNISLLSLGQYLLALFRLLPKGI